MVPRQLSWMQQGAWGLLVGQGHSPQLSPTPRGPWGLCRKHRIPAHTHNVVVVVSALLVMELEASCKEDMQKVPANLTALLAHFSHEAITAAAACTGEVGQ